ncbi:AIPR family protein [Streptomyces sp. 1222.5]|uniref:AIPR family protein n=1 Tax=Streptomyces sp. 1222.5 TaxID=1881026 RepID=UPI003EBF74C7
MAGVTTRIAKAVAQLVFTETPMSTSLGEGYVCLAQLDEYYRFITSENEALRLELFESNVRDYAGSTSVNNAIGETLKSATGEDFWWFNNGVTVVGDAAQIAGKKIVVKDPQIVNGLQTSHEIYSYFQNGGHHRDRSVLVEIVVVPESGTARDRIIRATNSQTQLPAGALRATESIQKDIEESLNHAGGYYCAVPATTATSVFHSTASSAWPGSHASSPLSSCASHTPRYGTRTLCSSTTSTTPGSSRHATTWTSTVSASTSTPDCEPS